jgi:hypothetical protein
MMIVAEILEARNQIRMPILARDKGAAWKATASLRSTNCAFYE